MHRVIAWLRAALGRPAAPDPVPVEVVLASPDRRHLLASQILSALERLQRTLGTPSGQVAVLVQQHLGERGLAGCCHVGENPQGQRYALLCLALRAGGRDLSPDDLLAVLAEQWTRLVLQQEGWTWTTLPLEHPPTLCRPAGEPPPPSGTAVLRGHAPSANGTRPPRPGER